MPGKLRRGLRAAVSPLKPVAKVAAKAAAPALYAHDFYSFGKALKEREDIEGAAEDALVPGWQSNEKYGEVLGVRPQTPGLRTAGALSDPLRQGLNLISPVARLAPEAAKLNPLTAGPAYVASNLPGMQRLTDNLGVNEETTEGNLGDKFLNYLGTRVGPYWGEKAHNLFGKKVQFAQGGKVQDPGADFVRFIQTGRLHDE